MEQALQTVTESLPKVSSRQEAEDKVTAIAHDTIARDRRLALLNEEVAKVRERFGDIQTLTDAISNNELALLKWLTENPGEYDQDKTSVAFTHGTVGFRKGREKVALLSRKTWEDVLACMQFARRTFAKCIRRKEEPDLIALLAWAKGKSCEERAAIGIKLTQEDKFYVSLKTEEVKA